MYLHIVHINLHQSWGPSHSHPIGPMGVRATLPPRCDYTSRVRFTPTYRDGRGSQEVSIAPSHGSYRQRIERNGPIIDPPRPRLRPPNLYIIRKLSETRIRLSNNTNFNNVALNAKFVTHATDLFTRYLCVFTYISI